jgi:hypothetical protein
MEKLLIAAAVTALAGFAVGIRLLLYAISQLATVVEETP